MLQFFLHAAERAFAGELCRAEFSGRKIQCGEANAVANLCQCRQEIIFFRAQQGIRSRTWRDDPRHFAPHQFGADLLPGQPRILHLLADGHLEAFADQFANVAFRGVMRNSTHRHGDAFFFVARGQSDLQFFRGHDGIVKEKLVEVAQAEEQ